MGTRILKDENAQIFLDFLFENIPQILNQNKTTGRYERKVRE